MLFHSLEFLLFFIFTFVLYIFLNHKWQNRLLLVASLIFYGFWDWRFLFLIFFSTSIDYFLGSKIYSAPNAKTKKSYLVTSIVMNLGVLGFFKYFNFFVDSFIDGANLLGLNFNPALPKIILPVGISFYTFQAMSYTIDIYRGQLKPVKSFFDFALFVSFFPKLIAGPIERSSHLLPQIINPRVLKLNEFYEGCHLFFWGLFEKLFIANSLVQIADSVFDQYESYDGLAILAGLYAFAFQIFADFDAYSNMARGIGKTMGFDLMINFNLPYFATNPVDFWRRWHISLSTWLRDYLYIPLGGNRLSKWKTYRNLMLTMILGGFWHGANWTFVFWGAYHGLLLVIYRAFTAIRKPLEDPNRWYFLRVIFFFHVVTLGWLLFRAESLLQAKGMLYKLIFDFHIHGQGELLLKTIFIILPLFIVQIMQYKTKDLLIIFHQHWLVKTLAYSFLTYLILGWGILKVEEFIYFQF